MESALQGKVLADILADYAGIDRSTYVHYEEYGKDLYPLEHMEKIAQLFEVPVDTLLDDYNLFLMNGQGNHKFPVKNYLIYFWIDEETKKVQIIGAVYGRKDQRHQLSNLDMF